MSEFISFGDSGENDVDAELALLAVKERWIQDVVGAIIQNRKLRVGSIKPELALDGARLASLWLDAFNNLAQDMISPSEDGVKEAIKAAMSTAQGLSETDHRYPSGILSLQLLIAAWDAFCLGFSEGPEEASRLLSWPMDCYGITAVE
jgi:hypothetical protein